MAPDAVLYVKSNCGSSRAVMLARRNVFLQDRLTMKNVTEDQAAREELMKIAGKDQAPCLVIGGKPIHEGNVIIQHLVTGATDIAG
jgi:hypothetical protein